MFSKACEYGIKATIFIATESHLGRRVSLNAIAKKINSPTAFTAKVLQHLSRNKIITSIKGPAGGFEIAKNQLGTIKLSDIVFAIDGDTIYEGCGLGFNSCNESKPCPVHHHFKQIRNDLKQMLETTSLMGLSKDILSGKTFFKSSF